MAEPRTPTQEEIGQLARLYQSGAMDDLLRASALLAKRFPAHAAPWIFLGSALEAKGQIKEALPALQRAVQLAPQRAEHHTHLGSALQSLGRLDEAEASYRQALAIEPTQADALFRLALLKIDRNRLPEAARAYESVLEKHPNHAQALFQLGVVHTWQEHWIEAEMAYRRALAIQPKSAMAWDSLGYALLELGRSREALECTRRATALEPENPHWLSNSLFAMNYVAVEPINGLPEEAIRYAALMSQNVHGPTLTPGKKESGTGPLRVGLVSGDLRRHAVTSFLVSILNNRSDRVLYFAYSTDVHEDEVTAEVRKKFAGWRSIAGVSSIEAAQIVASDEIQVLIDLAGHSGNNRLDLFAVRPAPVAVSWLGYPATTGLSQIDYVLTGRYDSDTGDQACFSELHWPLPSTCFCYAPPMAQARIDAPPNVANGHITFGSFNNLAKVNEQVIRVWSAILKAVPHSRLYLKNRQLGDPSIRRFVSARFEECGIHAERLRLQGTLPSRLDHLHSYNQIDIALDTFPYPGVTTSVEAFYMGVPVLTLRADGRMLRLGESIARELDMEWWIAKNETEYAAKAIEASEHSTMLSTLRHELRPRMERTDLLDAPRFTHNFEKALLEIWKTHMHSQDSA